MRHLPTYKGLPVPVVQFIGSDGTPDFKVIDEAKKVNCLKNRLCAICGGKLHRVIAFIGGEKSVRSRLFTDPGMHRECAKYAAVTCPFLANSEAGYSGADPKHLGDGQSVVREYELVCPMRAKKMAIYYTETYDFGLIAGQGPMIYVHAGPPVEIDWNAMPGSTCPVEPKRLWRGENVR